MIRASSSIPAFAPIVPYKGNLYLDGGTSDPIPVQKALADGCERLIVVLTRDRSFVKSPESFRPVYRRLYRKYPRMVETMDRRHEVYNAERELVFQLEKEGKAVVVAPGKPVDLSRFEKDPVKLRALYEEGMADAEKVLGSCGWIPSRKTTRCLARRCISRTRSTASCCIVESSEAEYPLLRLLEGMPFPPFFFWVIPGSPAYSLEGRSGEAPGEDSADEGCGLLRRFFSAVRF